MKARTDYYVTFTEVGDQALRDLIDITDYLHLELVIDEETESGDTVIVGPLDMKQYSGLKFITRLAFRDLN